MDKGKKDKIVGELKKIFPCDLSINEISRRIKLSSPTASTYLKVLEAEGNIEVSRKVGNAIFYRWKTHGKNTSSKNVEGEN